MSSACQQTLLGGTAAPTFLLSLVWRACTGSFLQTPESVCCSFEHVAFAAMSFRRCRCRTCSSGMPQTPPASTISLRRAGLWPHGMLQCSLQCPGLTGNEPHRTLDDLVRLTFSHWRSLWHSLTPFLAGLCNLSRQCFNCRLVVAPESDSVVPELVVELRCLSLRSKETQYPFSVPA